MTRAVEEISIALANKGAGTAPVFASVDSTGKFLFVGNQSSSTITEFKIDPTTGGLPSTAPGESTSSPPTSMFTTQ